MTQIDKNTDECNLAIHFVAAYAVHMTDKKQIIYI